MGLTRQSVHPMTAPKTTTSSLEEHGNEPHGAMSPSQRIADWPSQTPQTTNDSPRGSDLPAASGLASPGHGNMSARAATATTSPLTNHVDAAASRGAGGDDHHPPPIAKPDRRLVFADESGGVLAEITYSSRTHYSKQASTGTLPAGRACCVIS
jgi:hypothetical protein